MKTFLAHPVAWLALGALGLFILGLYYSLLQLWRGQATQPKSLHALARAARGPRSAEQEQTARLAELHQLVSKLETPPAEPPAEEAAPQ